MRTLVLGDCHGNYKGLMQALERSNFDYENDTLISLGDVVDGHSESYEVVEELLKIKNLIAVKGNHDDWFNTWIQTGKNPSNWQQGQHATGLSYLNYLRPGTSWLSYNHETGFGLDVSLKPEDIPKRHIDFFKNQLSYYIDDKNRLFIHGGFDRNYKLEDQDEFNFWWDRDLWRDALVYEGGHSETSDIGNGYKPKFNMVEEFDTIFIGHTSTQFSGSNIPMKAANIYNLDTGGGWHGYITIMDVDTKEFWQSDDGKTLYPDFKGR